MTRNDECIRQEHNLFDATFAAMSEDEAWAFVLCLCGAPRVLSAQDWDSVVVARRKLAQTHHAIERQPRQVALVAREEG